MHCWRLGYCCFAGFDGRKQSDYAAVCVFILWSWRPWNTTYFLSQHPCDSLYEGRNRFVICLLGSSFPFLAAEEWAAAWNLAVGTVLLAAPLNEVLWGVSMCIRVVAAQLLQGSDCEKQTFFKANQLCCYLPGRLIVTSTGPLKLSQLLVQSAFGDIKMQW